MKVRKNNTNYPIINDQKSDKVVIDGLMTAEELTRLGTEAGRLTTEQLNRLYPKNTEAELKELNVIEDEAFVDKLRELEHFNSENIEAYYNNELLKNKIHETRQKINKLNKEYERTRENNLIYEKDKEIANLKKQVAKLNKANK